MNVYFIKADESDAVKMGVSLDVNSRLAELQTVNPSRLKIVRMINGDKRMEKRLHDRYKDKRLMGEWFTFDPEMLLVDARKLRARKKSANVRERSAVPDGLEVLAIRFPSHVLDGIRKLARLNRRTIAMELIIASENHLKG